jgi:hypothetical protein
VTDAAHGEDAGAKNADVVHCHPTGRASMQHSMIVDNQ